MKKDTFVTVYTSEQFDDDYPPENALEFIEFLSNKINEIPVEYRNNAAIQLYSGRDHDVTFVSIRISYMRPETDEEEARREAEEREHNDAVRIRELRELAALREKYPDAG